MIGALENCMLFELISFLVIYTMETHIEEVRICKDLKHCIPYNKEKMGMLFRKTIIWRHIHNIFSKK